MACIACCMPCLQLILHTYPAAMASFAPHGQTRAVTVHRSDALSHRRLSCYLKKEDMMVSSVHQGQSVSEVRPRITSRWRLGHPGHEQWAGRQAFMERRSHASIRMARLLTADRRPLSAPCPQC